MATINRDNWGEIYLIETPVAGQIKNIVNVFAKHFMAGKKKIGPVNLKHVTGHWQVWQKVSFSPCM